MNREEMINLASSLLHLEKDVIENNCAVLDCGSLYFSLPEKGGYSLIVGSDGEVLFGNSSVCFSKLIEAFKSGTRTPKDLFYKKQS